MTQSTTLNVSLGARSYDIVIGHGVLQAAATHIAPILPRDRVAIVTDNTVAAHHLTPLTDGLIAAGVAVETLILPAGEASKSWDKLQEVVEWLLSTRLERDDFVIALGGGVIGDLVGFAAAILRRGIGFVQVPTTLLAQVDSSVGGKTGINSPQGKNLVGAFHQPRLVLADTGVLSTLSDRDYLAGYGEVVKYGLLGDAGFFHWMEDNGDAILSRTDAALTHMVRRSCEMKAEIVARDELEHGDRALLNLGHTFGHALEAATGYSDRLLHGEGVSIGCALAFETAMRLGLCSQEAPSRVRAHFAAMGMKKDLADISGALPDAAALIDLMRQDKKTRAGQITFIMSRDIGQAFVSRDVDLDVVGDVLSDALAAR